LKAADGADHRDDHDDENDDDQRQVNEQPLASLP
jgi:hypothetical protein